jgi:hypothetical protein
MKTKLEWADIYRLGKTDNARRWTPAPEIADYFRSIRAPSRAWPWSYAKAALTIKFARWLRDTHPELARAHGLLP